MRKAATMFEKVNVPVLGLIENMSYFLSPSGQGATTSLAPAAANGKRSAACAAARTDPDRHCDA